jgi:hypothetical protein
VKEKGIWRLLNWNTTKQWKKYGRKFKSVKDTIPNRQFIVHSTIVLHRFVLVVWRLGQIRLTK